MYLLYTIIDKSRRIDFIYPYPATGWAAPREETSNLKVNFRLRSLLWWLLREIVSGYFPLHILPVDDYLAFV